MNRLAASNRSNTCCPLAVNPADPLSPARVAKPAEWASHRRAGCPPNKPDPFCRRPAVGAFLAVLRESVLVATPAESASQRPAGCLLNKPDLFCRRLAIEIYLVVLNEPVAVTFARRR